MNTMQKTGVKRVTVLYPLPTIQESCEKTDKKLRVAAYCRVSTGSEEQLVSYHSQVIHYNKYIRSRPDYELAGIFADEGISGTDIRKWDGFNRLMQAAREGEIDLIITKSLSRFSRNTLECLKNLRELKMLGIDVYFEKENIHTLNSEGELLLSLVSAVAQNESMNLSENVKWGIHRKYEQGHVQSIPSGKFLGYKKDTQGNLIIDKAQEAVVQRIYQAFLNGFGPFQIAKTLTKEHVPMAFGGKEWCASHIYKVLTNEKYQGDTRFQKTYNVDYLTKRRAKNNGELPQYYLEDSHPAIIDRETWSLVQLELERQKQFVKTHFMNKYHQHSEAYPLSGKIICKVCRHTMVLRESMRKSDYGQKYWICKKFKAGRYGAVGPDACSNEHRIDSITVERLLVEIWNALINQLTQLQEHGHARLTTYRIRDLINLATEYGHLEAMPYQLLIRILEHIEIDPDGKITVFFLAGETVMSSE